MSEEAKPEEFTSIEDFQRSYGQMAAELGSEEYQFEIAKENYTARRDAIIAKMRDLNNRAAKFKAAQYQGVSIADAKLAEAGGTVK